MTMDARSYTHVLEGLGLESVAMEALIPKPRPPDKILTPANILPYQLSKSPFLACQKDRERVDNKVEV
jgi:hypothetical protein